jgi:hypothetical protein
MKKLIRLLAAFIGLNAQTAADDKQFPPVPKWKPEFSAPVNDQLERMIYYTDNGKDIAVFKHGTIVILQDGLNDTEAVEYAKKVLSEIYNYHPDMNPVNMDDGNILVQYNHPAYNVVISEFANKHLANTKKNHLDALATDEVLITPMGSNKFDEFGMKALYGRTFMFMDAQSPKIVQIYRPKSSINSVQPTTKASAD